MAIWHAAVAAVDSRRLVRDNVRVERPWLWVGGERLLLSDVRRILVVGAGKAGAGMAEGFEGALGEAVMAEKQVTGWINVPEDCVRPLKRIHLHAARPPGLNEPTPAGVQGAEQILQLVRSAADEDLCVCLLSGGGSALLPAPAAGITLADKQALARHLSAAGANIRELNAVRKQLSRIKGGGLARACRAGCLITLIISDVLGDPLEVIASGPTVPDPATPHEALDILRRFAAREAGISPRVFEFLTQAAEQPLQERAHLRTRVVHRIIGNNAKAVDAAGAEAERRGYAHAMMAATQLEGQAEDVGRHLAEMADRMRREPGPDCLITGGEPVVQLAPPDRRGLGGRNQQLVLAALDRLIRLAEGRAPEPATRNPLQALALLSGGTDGEDGPTDAAGAMIDEAVFDAMCRQHMLPQDYLRRNDAYHFFQPLGALIKTGPTHTNVCDVRVAVVSRHGRR